MLATSICGMHAYSLNIRLCEYVNVKRYYESCHRALHYNTSYNEIPLQSVSSKRQPLFVQGISNDFISVCVLRPKGYGSLIEIISNRFCDA